MPGLPIARARRAAAESVAAALGADPAQLTVSIPPDPALGDYSVGCFPLAKPLRTAPAALAQKAAQAFRPTPLLTAASAAGPYVNFQVDRAALFGELFASTLAEGGRPIPPIGAGKTVCVDYSSPNIAKHLAYHHIRSTVIGQTLCNLHRALGYRVVGINHLGDWGTTFGMLLAATHRWGLPDPFSIADLNAIYVRFRNAAKEEPALEDEGRAWFKKIEDGDLDARSQWQRFRAASLAEFQEVYDALGVRFDEVRGESEYESAMPGVIAMLEQKQLAVISDGALVVDLADENIPPLLLRKADGTTLYATRDLAAAIYRYEAYEFTRSLYVVDKGQALHFKQLFSVLRRAGFAWADRLEHVPFGLVRLGGKKAGTRTGNVVLLKEVLAEAQARVAALLEKSSSDLTPEVREHVAQVVGVGAIVFANLAAQREKDVDFEWEQIVSLDGDAGPYVQYGHARTASVLRRGQIADPTTLAAADPAPLVRTEEWELAKKLTDLADEVQRAAETDEPHVIARYLLDVCASFSRWYTVGNQDPTARVLSSDPATARARLALAAATKRILKDGLALLGLGAPDVM